MCVCVCVCVCVSVYYSMFIDVGTHFYFIQIKYILD